LDVFGLHEGPKLVDVAVCGRKCQEGGKNRGRGRPWFFKDPHLADATAAGDGQQGRHCGRSGGKCWGRLGLFEFPELAVSEGNGVLEGGDVRVEILPAEGERRRGAGG
jgi:hypothetical protein